MKKIILLLFLGLFVLSSCKKEYVPVNNSQTILFDVPSSSWQTSDGISYDMSLDVPEITSYFNSTGQVSVYISFGNGVFEQIPEVYNDVSLSFTHNVGDVTIYAQDLNHVGMPPPADATVKVILTDSSQ